MPKNASLKKTNYSVAPLSIIFGPDGGGAVGGGREMDQREDFGSYLSLRPKQTKRNLGEGAGGRSGGGGGGGASFHTLYTAAHEVLPSPY